MKKLNYLLLGAAGLILASCSNDDFVAPGSTGDTSNITITLDIPKLQTRDFADGKTATSLEYALYEVTSEGNVYRKSYEYEDVFETSATITLSVANGHSYKVVFWASADGSPYTVDFENGGDVTVNYNNATSNSETLDAFFGIADLKNVNGDKNLEAHLKRPFAQINVGTNDFEKFEESTGNKVISSSIELSNAYSKLNLLSGKVSELKNNVKFTASAIPSGETFKKDGYDYLAMVYLLATEESETYDITYGYTESGKEETTKTVGQVPVQRNHRTNLYGQLLTSNQNVNVDKEPDLDDPDNENTIVSVPDGMVKLNGETYNTVKAALEVAMNSLDKNPVIHVGENKDKSPIIVNDEFIFTATRAANVFESIKIKGAGAKENIVFQFKDGNAIYGHGILNFENITMKVDPSDRYQSDQDKGPWFINVAQQNYKGCVIEGCVGIFVTESASFENCDFTNTQESGFKANSIYYYSGDKTNVYVNNCNFNTRGKGILIYSTGERQMDLTVENSVFNSSKSDTDKAAIQIQSEKNCYGTVKINNVKATGFLEKNYGIWDEIDNENHVDKNNYNIYVDGELVQGSSWFVVDGVWFKGANEAFKAIKDNSVVDFGAVTVSAGQVTWPQNMRVTIQGKGTEFSKIDNIEWQAVTGCDLTVKDLTIDVLIRTGNHTSMGFKGLTKGCFENVVFNGEWHTFDGPQIYKKCIFNYNAASDGQGKGRYNVYNYAREKSEFIGCNFNSKDCKALLVYDNENTKNKNVEMKDILVEDCVFDSTNDPRGNASSHACVEVHIESYKSFATIIINNATIIKNFTEKGIFYEGDNSGILASITGPTKKDNCRVLIDGEEYQKGKL